MKSFFGGLFIEKERLMQEGISHPIKLEYYKKYENGETKDENKNLLKYGIEVVKTEYINNQVLVEKEEISNLTSDEKIVNKILLILKENQVTPVGTKDVIIEIFSKNLQNKSF